MYEKVRGHCGPNNQARTYEMAIQTLRLPRGLWEDLEQTVIVQDRQWLTMVARELGIPVAEALKKVLGTGAPQQVAVLMAADTLENCPWHDRLGDGLWMPCARQRLSATRPCQFHERPRPSASLTVACKKVHPYSYEGRIYWTIKGDSEADIFREDGTLETGFRFKFRMEEGEERVRIIPVTDV